MLLWRILQRMSPLGWIAGGVVLALSVPAVRKRLMSVATTAIDSVMPSPDNVKVMGNSGNGQISTLEDAGL